MFYKKGGGMSEIIAINLLGQELKINCPQDSESKLEQAALDLEIIMQNIKNKSKASNREQITILAALELAYKLNEEKRVNKDQSSMITKKIKSIDDMFKKII